MAKHVIFNYSDYRTFLIDEFQRRIRTNEKYSLRSMSRELGLRAPALSDILAGRYGLSSSAAQSVASKLGLNAEESLYFVSLVEIDHGRSSAIRGAAEKRLRRIRSNASQFKQLADDQFNLFSKWYHPVVLEMISMHQTAKTSDIASAIGITSSEVNSSIDFLVDLGFVQKSGSRYLRSTPFLIGDSSTPQAHIRTFHKQLLQLASKAIDRDAAQLRKSLSTVMSFDASRLAEARNEIDAFHSKLIEKFETSKKPDSVFGITIQLFRIDHPQ